MKVSNQGQFEKARKQMPEFFKDSSSATKDKGDTMDKAGPKAMRLANGGSSRQPRDGNMKFASGGFPRHSMKEDARDKKADAISAKKVGMKPSAFEGTAADEKMDKMGTAPKAPRNKVAKLATGGKPVKRNMGGMMGAPMGDGMGSMLGRPQKPPMLPGAPPQMMKSGMAAPPPGLVNPMDDARARLMSRPPMPGGNMAGPTPRELPDPMQQVGGDGPGFKRGGAPKPIRRAMGGVGKSRHEQATESGQPKTKKGPKLFSAI